MIKIFLFFIYIYLNYINESYFVLYVCIFFISKWLYVPEFHSLIPGDPAGAGAIGT